MADGIAAELALIEPNEDSVTVECICRTDGTTEIGSADPEVIEYLHKRYGDRHVCITARSLVIGDRDLGASA